MRLDNLGGCKTIHEYVTGKLRRLEKEERSFSVLFRYMFSEEKNIFYEKYEQFRIVKTTYKEASDEIIRRGRALKTILSGVPAQSVIGLSMQNSMEWLLNYWAILYAGYRPLFMNLRLNREALTEALSTLHAAAVVSDGDVYEVRTVTEEEIRKTAAQVKTPEEAGQESGKDTDAETGFGDTFYVMSSGTSSHVKLCAYTANELFSLLKDSEEIVSESRSVKKHYEGELKQLTFLPFYHIFGFVAVYLWFGFFARTFVELKDYAPDTILSTIRRHRVTHVFAVPLFWEKVYAEAVRTIRDRGDGTFIRFKKGMELAGKLEKTPVLFRLFTKAAFTEVRKNLFGESICFMISGGGGIRSEALSFFNRIGYHLANGYGMSEIGISSVNLSEKAKSLEAGSVGKPLRSYRYKIEDGILYAGGKSLAAYIVTDGVRRDRPEWFCTGDLARERKGVYFIDGRGDDLIVDASGENLNPNMLEPKLVLPGIREVALVAARYNGSIAPVLIAGITPFLSEDRFREVDEALRRQLEQLHIKGLVRKIFYTTSRLLSDTDFKLNRRRIARAFEDGLLSEREPADKRGQSDREDELGSALRALYAEALGKTANEVGYETDFFTEEGGSSLDYLLLLSRIREKFGVGLKDGEGETVHSLKALEEKLRKRIDDVDSVL